MSSVIELQANMTDIVSLRNELQKARSELKNIRQQLIALKMVHQKDIANIRELLKPKNKEECIYSKRQGEEQKKMSDMLEQTRSGMCHFQPIGYIQSVFTEKNGTPRQANVCQSSQAIIEIRKDLYSNPEHSLEGLEEYSHVWLFFLFHKNNSTYSKAKVAPPRLNGTKLGVFSTRSPHRPNPIGLSLVRLNQISGCCLHLGGVDILDGTPVLDIKPYIPQYDSPQWDMFMEKRYSVLNKADTVKWSNECSLSTFTAASLVKKSLLSNVQSEGDMQCLIVADKDDKMNTSELDYKKAEDILGLVEQSATHAQHSCSETSTSLPSPNTVNTNASVAYAEWIEKPPIPELTVIFSSRAENELRRITAEEHPSRSIRSWHDTREAITCILAADPRSTYRRQHCQDRLYYFTVDKLHVTCWFDDDDDVVEILKIKLVADKIGTNSAN